MAQRRMLSLKIVDAARFVKMPPSARLLYYDLNIRADDDGIVEAWNVMRMTGSAEDDLKVLAAKGFVTVLNEDLVTHILDWKEHNLIRSDRKVDSIYKDLLVRVVPGVELIEPRQRADLKKKELHEEQQTGQPTDVQRTADGQPTDSIGKVRLGQDSLGQDIKDSLPGDEPPDPPIEPPKESASRFKEFWDVYPRKDNKKKAESAFNRLRKTDIDIVIADVIARSKTEAWKKENRKYVPMATTYLNGKRWEDEKSEANSGRYEPYVNRYTESTAITFDD